MEAHSRHYLPAAGHDWALALYDPFTKLFGADAHRRVLVERAALRPGDRVLDVGCGTGTLLAEIKRRYPSVVVTGVDPDPRALARARHKAARAGAVVALERGFATELPFADASFERVFSSFMFHHLAADEQAAALREIRRVLVPSGALYLLDFAGPEHHGHGLLARLLHARPRLHFSAGISVTHLGRVLGPRCRRGGAGMRG